LSEIAIEVTENSPPSLQPTISATKLSEKKEDSPDVRSAPVMPEHPPVTDWVTISTYRSALDRKSVSDLGRVAAECPVVHTKRFIGLLPADHVRSVKQIAYDTEHFSSREYRARRPARSACIGRHQSHPNRRYTKPRQAVYYCHRSRPTP